MLEWLVNGTANSLLDLFANASVVHIPGGGRLDTDGLYQFGERLHRRLTDISLDVEHFPDDSLHAIKLDLRATSRDQPGHFVRVRGFVTCNWFGGKVVSAWFTGTVDETSSAATVTAAPRLPDWARRWRLTEREASVAWLAMQGLRDKQVAARLDLAPASAAKYLRNVLRKSGAQTRWQLAEQAGVVCVG